MQRVVAAEALDSLAEDDALAMASRRDLRRVHRAMGTCGTLVRALHGLAASHRASAPLRLLELGAGDGSLMLRVAGALGKRWPAVELTLLDRQRLVSEATMARYAGLGWKATPCVMDALDWAAGAGPLPRGSPAPAAQALPRWDAIVCSLFLHHFEGAALAALLAAAAARGHCFFACEPRRARLALAGSHLIGAIGANAVTRADAVLSVHAGFQGGEISALWPGSRAAWRLDEYPAGLFSHCFVARRTGPGATP